MAFETLQDVFVDQLKDLLSAEKQIIKALPKLVKAASNEKLQEALEEHLGETRGQVDRLEKVFSSIGMTARAKKCEGMAGLLKEGEEVLEHRKDSSESALDAAIVAACQKVEHYEISAYGSARAFAEELGHSKAAELLQETLDEESDANEQLNEIATDVNAAAAEGSDDSEETDEDEDQEMLASAGSRGSASRGRSRAMSARSR